MVQIMVTDRPVNAADIRAFPGCDCGSPTCTKAEAFVFCCPRCSVQTSRAEWSLKLRAVRLYCATCGLAFTAIRVAEPFTPEEVQAVLAAAVGLESGLLERIAVKMAASG